MILSIEQCTALAKLYPQVTVIRDNTAHDADGNQVEYDLNAVNDKVAEMQAEEDAKKQDAHEKLAAFGLTPDDLKRILG